MKTMTMILERAVNIAIIVILLLPITVGTIGCGDTEDPLKPTTDLTKDTAVGVFASAKHNNTAPAAPQMPGVGIPRVTEVGFYHDWKLEKPISTPVQPGKTIYIKIVFSEPMKHVVSDGKEAKPIIYHKVDKGQQIRFKMAARGARGEDFVSGDAKPLHGGTDDYLCKLIVPDAKNITLCVGKWNIDLQGNPLEKFYRHPVEVEVQNDLIRQTPVEVVEVGYHADESLTEPLVDSVMEGTTIYTKIVFSGAVPVVVADDSSARPKIFYNSDGGFRAETQYRMRHRGADLQDGDAKLYRNTDNIVICRGRAAWVRVGYHTSFMTQVNNRTPTNELDITVRPVSSFFLDEESPPPEGSPGDFIGQVRTPLRFRAMEHTKPIAGVTVTIVSGQQAGKSVITDKGGYYYFPDVRGDELHVLVEREYFEPKEAIVHRSRPTTLPDRVPLWEWYQDDAQNTPGIILMGMRWPDEVRFILDEVFLVPDLLCTMRTREEGVSVGANGLYNPGLVQVLGNVHLTGTLAHEIAHAHQHAIGHLHLVDKEGWGQSWMQSPEGRAYIRAMHKDLREVGKIPSDSTPGYDSSVPDENAANICSDYWVVDAITGGDGLEIRAPNRYKWCQEWLNKKY